MSKHRIIQPEYMELVHVEKVLRNYEPRKSYIPDARLCGTDEYFNDELKEWLSATDGYVWWKNCRRWSRQEHIEFKFETSEDAVQFKLRFM